MTINPYAPAAPIDQPKGVFGDHATLIRQTFLYRVIEITDPLDLEIVYDGWWFRQTVIVNGESCWWQLTWLSFANRIEFTLPAGVDELERRCEIEIGFARGANIKRFSLRLDDYLVYDEFG
ncbi:MAG: hypothetical protein AAFP90_18590 [Planctomycetota bacterium]